MRKARRNFPRKPLVKGKNRRMLDFFCVCWSIIHLRWEKRRRALPRSLASPGPGWALWWGRGRKKGTASPRKSLPSLPRQQNPAGKAQQGKPERAPALCLFGRAALGGSPAVGRLSRRPARKYDGYSHSTMSHRKSQQHSSPREENVVGNFPRRRGIPPCILRDIGL